MRQPYAILILLLALPMLAWHADATDISVCSNLNSAGTTYNLTASITNSGAYGCMNVTANNIILDCGGFTIDGNGGTGIYGINATARTNITIRNCILTDWTDNIRFSNVNDSLIENTNVTRTFGGGNRRGINLLNSNNNIIRNITGRSTGEVGILLSSSNYNVLTGIVFNSSTLDNSGIELTASHYNIINNSILKENLVGIQFKTTGSNYSYIYNNTLQDNTYGIYDDQSSPSSHNLIRNNSFIRNHLVTNNGPNNTYSYNVFYGTPSIANLIVHSSGSTQSSNISHNIIYGGGAGGMQILGGAYNIDFNTISNVSVGIFISSSVSSNISSNVIENGASPATSPYGIAYGVGMIIGTDLHNVHNNTLRSIYAGIEIRNRADNNTISNNTIYNVTNGIVFVGEPGYDNPPGPQNGPENTTVTYNNITNTSTAIVLGVPLSANQIAQNKRNAAFSVIRSNNISNNNIGIKFLFSPNNSIIDNTFDINSVAMKVTSSENNTIENNTFINNGDGVNFDPAPHNILNRNLFKRNGVDLLDDSNSSYTNNVFYLPDNSTFLKFNGNAIGSLNSLFNFNFSAIYPNGSSAAYALNSITLYPSRSFAYTNTSNTFTGNFTPVDGGINSLLFNITVGSNTLYISYPMFMGGDIQETKTYYLNSSEPTRGQPKGLDLNNSILGKALKLDRPTGEFISDNTTTHIFSVEDNPLSVSNVNIIGVNVSLLYRSTGTQRVNLGIGNNVGSDNATILNTTFPASSVFIENSSSFSVNWTMDSPNRWFRLGGKLIGNNVTWKTNSTHASHLNLTYQYAASAPKVFNITEGAKVLSSASNSSSYVILAIDGDSPANFTVQLPSSSTYTILYDSATCASPTCNATQSGNNATVSVSLGSIHTVEFYIPTTATTTTTTSSGGGGSLVDVKGNVLQPGGIPTVDEQASTTSVPPSSVPARPGTYTISEDGAVILLEGNLTAGNDTTPGTVYIVGYPQSPFIVGGIVKSDPLKYGSLPQRSGFATKSLTSYDIEIKSGVAYFCMNYRGFENPSSVTVFEFTNGAWRELPRDRFANNLTTSTACGTVKGTPYMVAGFVSTGTAPVSTVVALPTAVTSIPLVVYALGALAAVVYFAYRFRSRRK